MSALNIVHQNLAGLIRFVQQLASYAVVFVFAFASSRARTTAIFVALRSQLARRINQVQQKKELQPRFTAAFRVVWVVISRFLDDWEDLA